MLFRTILNEVVPERIREYVSLKVVDFTFVIEERWEFAENQTFRAPEVYLPTRLAGLSTSELLVGSSDLKNPAAEPKLGIAVNKKIIDEFEGIRLEWTLHSVETKKYCREKRCWFVDVLRYFHLTCKKEFREKIQTNYFTYLAKSAEKIMKHREDLEIFTYNKKDSCRHFRAPRHIRDPSH
ncbi:hypothetical protein YC2023_054077 [Brassica napus]